ncbi:MAG: hypothetical protein AAFP90_21285 [Planctomycetota bacterium]
MKTGKHFLLHVTTIVGMIWVCSFTPSSAETPNIVIVLADDLGWTDTDGQAIPQRTDQTGFRSGEGVDFEQPVSGGPIDVGFDSYFGISPSLDMSPYVYLLGNRVISQKRSPSPANKDGCL